MTIFFVRVNLKQLKQLLALSLLLWYKHYRVRVTENPALAAILFNPFKPEFTIVIFIHYKPRIAVAILDL